MINFFTIVLDGEPWIERHLRVFESLGVPWHWVVVEGVANNVNCTQWCAKSHARLSNDGTTRYLGSLSTHGAVTVLQRPFWQGGKVQMCNAALEQMNEAGLLWQVDSDEIWTKDQILAVERLFIRNPERNCAWFWCRYFVGKDIVTVRPDPWSNNPAFEWKRVWRFEPGIKFKRHEPPVLDGFTEKPLTHADTESVGAIFDHFSYATLEQVKFKAKYYAGERNPHGAEYRRSVDGWKRLQEHKGPWPVKLKDYLPFVAPETLATKL